MGAHAKPLLPPPPTPDSAHQKWLLPLMSGAFCFLVLWSLRRSDSIPPLEHPKPNPTAGLVWPREGWDAPPPAGKCRRTKFFPFKIGCPISCCGYRPEAEHDPQQPFYRFSILWDFGALFPEMHNASELASMSDADLAERLNCTPAMARAFATSESVLTSKLPFAINKTVKFKPQLFLHMALSYFCCLKLAEAQQAVAALQNRGIQAELLSPPVAFRFSRLECWRERIDSVTNILIADNATQRQLLSTHHEVKQFLRREVPSLTPALDSMPLREEQMPFHVTVLGLSASRLSPKDPIGNISTHLKSIAHAVEHANGEIKPFLRAPTALTSLEHVKLRPSPIVCHSNCDRDRP
mmetsp:Transcript_20986/g.83671  ORF Transcript_20986/g.83671 Transcript_20986/m.83671 type:complete len:352 (-) Transcript_20986:406-1461(-)